jgi:predicted aconitase with swiveling domain
MSSRIIADAGMGRRVEGEALVAKDGFSARYDLDRARGVFSRSEHKLAGQSYVGRVLVLDAAKGGVATAWMLHEMNARCRAGGSGLERRQPHHGSGRGACRLHHDLRFCSRHHARDPERRMG